MVDIGGGTTDIAVISLGGAVVTDSIKVAGDMFDDSIIRYMRKNYNLLIGDRTAERMKINIGSAIPVKRMWLWRLRAETSSPVFQEPSP